MCVCVCVCVCVRVCACVRARACLCAICRGERGKGTLGVRTTTPAKRGKDFEHFIDSNSLDRGIWGEGGEGDKGALAIH